MYFRRISHAVAFAMHFFTLSIIFAPVTPRLFITRGHAYISRFLYPIPTYRARPYPAERRAPAIVRH